MVFSRSVSIEGNETPVRGPVNQALTLRPGAITAGPMTIHPDTEADNVKRLAIILASANLLIDLLNAGEFQAVATLLEQILDHPAPPSVM